VFKVEREAVQLPNNAGTTQRHRLTLLTDKGLVQALLEEVTSLRFTDPQTKAQLDRALAGLSTNRAKDRRSLQLGVLGTGTRNMGLSYLVAAPIWKSAYRLVLPPSTTKEGGKVRLQGWAVVENLTGGDWKDVDLALISGNPVALRQALYSAFFADRPEIPVTTSVRVLPRRDDADEQPQAPRGRQEAARSAAAPPAFANNRQQMGQLARNMAAPAPTPMMPGAGGAADATESNVLATAAQAAEAEEAQTQLLYRFPAKVSLPTGHTMMVPFIDREVAATRTWLYQPETSARRPLAAVRVRNDGDTGLPPGIVTAFELAGDGATNFVGDAQLPLLPKGSFKFVTFALDAKTDIRRTDKGVRRTVLGKAVNGELSQTVRSRRTIEYEITPPADEEREIVIEEVREDGWKAAADMKDVEETPTRFRAKALAPKGQTTKSALVLERLDRQTVVLTDLSPDQILATIRGLDNEGAALKDAVAKLSGIVAEISRAKAERARLEAERKRIGEDQERLRRNLQTVGQNTDIGRRYLDTLRTQEDRLVEIGRLEQGLDAEIASKTKSAEEAARQLSL
jgi:Domain of unknown function (DUF4139)